MFLGIEAEVRVDRENQPILSGEARALEEVFGRLGIALVSGVISRPQIDDAEISVRIESADEFFPLMEHVALELVAHTIPGEHVVRLHHILPRTAFDGIEMDEGLVRDHAGERQAIERSRAIVIIATVEMRVVFDGEDLFEKDQPVEHRGFEAGGDGDHVADALRETGGKGQSDQAADGWADDGVQGFDAEVIEQAREHFDLVRRGDCRERRAPRFSGVRIDRGWAGAAVTAAEIVRAEDE